MWMMWMFSGAGRRREATGGRVVWGDDDDAESYVHRGRQTNKDARGFGNVLIG